MTPDKAMRHITESGEAPEEAKGAGDLMSHLRESEGPHGGDLLINHRLNAGRAASGLCQIGCSKPDTQKPLEEG